MTKLNEETSQIELDNIKDGLTLTIKHKKNTFFEPDDALANNEAEYQIVEGNYYEYKFNKEDYYFKKSDSNIINPSSFSKTNGRIEPNIYVGTLDIPIFKKGVENKVYDLSLEVQSIKASYREDYRFMLEEITEKTTDLLLQVNSPTSHSFTQDPDEKNETLYQKFAFVKSIINSDEFKDAVQKIISSPVSKWIEESELTDVRKIKKFGNKEVRQLINSSNRMKLSTNHPLYNKSRGVKSIASKIYSNKKKESVDTSENQFIKHALEIFLKFCIDIESHKGAGERLKSEAKHLIFKLEDDLQNNFFKEISRPTILELNSPALQRKEGYRHILKVWLMFDLAAKLVWHGGDDVYKAGKRNVAKLYEYWLFFTLLDLISKIFDIKQESIEKLIKDTDDKLGLQLKEGKFITLKGVYKNNIRELNVELSYNKTFGKDTELNKEGSWTLQMDPDYTLSIWPKETESKETAEERNELIHIHFDAKYKVQNKETNSKFKREDIIKMHAYKDAIRRTAGAYILYPGTDNKPTKFEGFHEVLPGLGAFAIRPNKKDNGVNYLEEFIRKVVDHFLDRTSQREYLAIKSYYIHENDKPNMINVKIPENIDEEKLIPSETFVLVGYYKGKEHYNWIKSKKLYNFRTDNLTLDYETVGARYLLLHTTDEKFPNKIFKIVKNSMKIYSQQELINSEYPTIPSKDYYMVFELEEVEQFDFNNINWNIKELDKFKKFAPFTVTLTKLMQVVK